MPHATCIPYGGKATVSPCSNTIRMKFLIETLGVEGAKRFLKHSIPLIQQRHLALRESLSQGNWELASKQAHSIKGTINLYGHPALTECLENIIAKNISLISSKNFLSLLQTEQQQAEFNVHRFLSVK